MYIRKQLPRAWQTMNTTGNLNPGDGQRGGRSVLAQKNQLNRGFGYLISSLNSDRAGRIQTDDALTRS